MKGGIKVTKPQGFRLNVKRDPRIIIGPNAIVEGPLVFERPVTLYVHTSAKIGPVTGATAKSFSTDTAPAATAYSRMSAQPTIQAMSSPIVA